MLYQAFHNQHSPFSSRYNTTGYSEPKLYVKKTKKQNETCCSNPFKYMLSILLCRNI